MKAYHDILRQVLEEGVISDDRTGTGTMRTTGAMFKHNMQDGFPLVTTKKVNPNTVFSELEFFIKGLTDKQWLKDRKCNIWNSWSYKDGRMLSYDKQIQSIYERKSNDLGVLYGFNWRHYGGDKQNHYPNANIPYNTLKKPINDDIHSSKNYGDFVILNDDNKSEVSIQFIETGYEMSSSNSNLIRGQVKDPYFKKYFGVACIGEYNKTNLYHTHLKSIWCNMISRCYNVSDKDYNRYGANGIYVSNDWLIFANFQDDVSKLPNWDLKKSSLDEYTLDKDVNGGHSYSIHNCMWLDKKTQSSNKIDTIHFDVITPNGDVLKNITSLTDFCNKNGLDVSDANSRLNGKYKYTIQGFDFINPRRPFKDKFKMRPGIDQLKNAIEILKTNPTNRRIIVTAWNPVELDNMALPPCHHTLQFTSDGDYLDLTWFQRSVDTFLGLPFNIASYGMLLELVAATVGMKARYLVGQLVDVHIYTNHFTQVKTQLSREPKALPKLVLPENLDIFTWEYQQYQLVGYDPHPFIKAPIAV